MFDAAQAAVEAALAAGARYADARVVATRSESLRAQDGLVEDVDAGESTGLGVRALVGSAWGFAATPRLSGAEVRRAGERAALVARASNVAAGLPVELLPEAPSTGHWENAVDEDPFAVPLSEKGDLFGGVTGAMKAAGADLAVAHYSAWDVQSWLVSSEGTRVSQRVRKCGGGMNATTVGEDETQRRSYPSAFGQYAGRGYELIREFDLPGHVDRVVDEARALLAAPQCPAGVVDLILDPEQMALQIHESVGHAVELDRILGWEAAFAGTSWLDLSRLGSLRFGSPLMTITADATLPGALGSFGYDDEGTPARPVDIVREGTWVGVLSGRDSAARAGLRTSAACIRADGWSRLPMVRMTNVGLLPGDSSLEEMIAETDDGLYMENNRSWSIDDRRLNFQFGCEAAWEVKKGRRGRLLRNPTYTGIGPTFWNSLDMLGNRDEWVFWGTPNCGKGQPLQIGHTGHPAVPARFHEVRVGVDGGRSRG
ncbi:MAG TPA: TldD/PmbA family protein [Frankiaceae bacterium]|nr:TldD/PmbA family protein [Frankiaceae bacterium]